MLRQAFEILVDGREVRALDRCHQPAIDRQADDNVSQGKFGPGDIGLGGRELMFENSHFLVPASHADLDAMRVLILRILAHQCHERVAPRGIEIGGLPVHPLLHPGARSRFAGQQLVVVLVFRGQVAADGIGLPQHPVLVNDHRHLGVGIEPEELWAMGRGKPTAPILALEGQTQFLAGPQDFADVDRRGFAENFQ
ncbi:hypothetical protein D3C71_1211760 [compost metagenome]